jgi:hypothetical protein
VRNPAHYVGMVVAQKPLPEKILYDIRVLMELTLEELEMFIECLRGEKAMISVRIVPA